MTNKEAIVCFERGNYHDGCGACPLHKHGERG